MTEVFFVAVSMKVVMTVERKRGTLVPLFPTKLFNIIKEGTTGGSHGEEAIIAEFFRWLIYRSKMVKVAPKIALKSPHLGRSERLTLPIPDMVVFKSFHKMPELTGKMDYSCVTASGNNVSAVYNLNITSFKMKTVEVKKATRYIGLYPDSLSSEMFKPSKAVIDLLKERIKKPEPSALKRK
ncbi:M protein [Rose virus R]|uniref:M protein n=1 Tax=Rose virus R TaxID=2805917 RepID=A0AAE7P8F7_9RHAB|nr:M protein [Rose virus R]QQZ02076.1 M protein [Rose virus R]